MTVSFIIPAYNEAQNLEKCVMELRRSISIPDDFGIIIAEDGSTDSTHVIATKLANNGKVIHLHSDDRLGRGKALRNAFKKARGDVVVYMDVDLSTDPSVLPTLITAVRFTKGMATASRRIQGAKVKRTTLRKVTSICYNWLVRLLFRDGIYDHQCGCKAFHRDMIQGLLDEVKSDGWFWDTEIILRAKMRGYSVTEVPCAWSEPNNRKSKVKLFWDALSMGMSAIQLYMETRRKRFDEVRA